jgi:hypothetical protein
MFPRLFNFLFRAKDPTRLWTPDRNRLAVDIRRCTLCEAALGGPFENLHPLGPSENARRAARGYPEWCSKGIYCMIENERLADFTVIPLPSRRFRGFTGQILSNGKPLAITNQTTTDHLIELLGEPFGTSNNDWDDATVVFYEFETGEVQFAFDKSRRTLDSIEFWYEPELSQKGACETYGIPKTFPDRLRRTLPSAPLR